MQLPPLGLYIHLPWCQRKCPYCDFNSHESDRIPEEQYIRALLLDLQDDLPLLQDRAIDTVFIGGGTPSLFSARGLQTLLNSIAERVDVSPGAEITMEANPGSAEADKFHAIQNAGVNRLSLGIQSFNDLQLQALGRVHSSDEAHAAIASAQSAGFDSINLDLMHGLPGQGVTEASNDLRQAIATGTEHLSWYQLTIEPNTVFHKRPPQLPVEDELAEIQLQGEALLADAGFSQYEVSAYSRNGFQCRHNRNYWTFGDYLGIGAGAHAKITFSDGRIERFAKRRQPGDYMAGDPGSYIAQGRTLEITDIIGEYMMNALRLNEGFTLAQFVAHTGLEGEVLDPLLEQPCQSGLLVCENNVVIPTALGRRFLDSLLESFLPPD